MNKDKVYVSYLHMEFDKKYFNCNDVISLNPFDPINKPRYGFWASPIDAEFGWKDFCEQNQMEDMMGGVKFTFKLSKDAKIFNIKDLDDIERLPYTSSTEIAFAESVFVDFDELKRRGYDGVELFDSGIGHYFANKKELCFNAWDCESIVIWNPDIIIPINEEDYNMALNDNLNDTATDDKMIQVMNDTGLKPGQIDIVKYALEYAHNIIAENFCLKDIYDLETAMDYFGVEYTSLVDAPDTVYISYLQKPFDKTSLQPKEKMNNLIHNKPCGGFWASPVDAKFGWKEFCEDWLDISDRIEFKFTLSRYANIITVEYLDDVNKLIYGRIADKDRVINHMYIDFDTMKKLGYDGIELKDPNLGHLFAHKDFTENSDLYKKQECFYCWDCESIVIWNPDIIIPVED